MSSKSVASVVKEVLVHGAEEGVREVLEIMLSLSLSDASVDSAIGAGMKWLPRGVGKLSLRGESHSAVLDTFCCCS
jgi:hypothetical protein